MLLGQASVRLLLLGIVVVLGRRLIVTGLRGRGIIVLGCGVIVGSLGSGLLRRRGIGLLLLLATSKVVQTEFTGGERGRLNF